MTEEKCLTDTQGLFKNYNRSEIDSLLWEMYKGWFLHNATEVDSDKMIDMLLFYGEVKNLLMNIPLPDAQPL